MERATKDVGRTATAMERTPTARTRINSRTTVEIPPLDLPNAPPHVNLLARVSTRRRLVHRRFKVSNSTKLGSMHNSSLCHPTGRCRTSAIQARLLVGGVRPEFAKVGHSLHVLATEDSPPSQQDHQHYHSLRMQRNNLRQPTSRCTTSTIPCNRQ